MVEQETVFTVVNVVVVCHSEQPPGEGSRLAAAMVRAVQVPGGDEVIILHDATAMSTATDDYAQAFRALSGQRVRQVAVVPRPVRRFFARVAMTLVCTQIALVRNRRAVIAWIQAIDPASAAALERQAGSSAVQA